MISLSREDILKLAQIVREETGNQVQEKNYSMLEARIRNRLLKLEIPRMDGYWEYFRGNELSERAVIQGLMTTHYTFFFREFVHFEVLGRWIESEIARLKRRYLEQRQPLRVWSAACSRGQEVYSLAMYLDLVLTKAHSIPFEVLGTDIDAQSLSYARNGVFPLKEVNTIPQVYLQTNWKKGIGSIADFAAVKPELKARCRFESLNLMELAAWTRPFKFDVVFCRNVFIYFSEENVRKIAMELADRIEDDGLLVSGSSEPLRFPGWNLETVGPSCYRKQSSPFAAKPKTQKIAPPARAETERAYRVLCVDDSPTIQLLIKKIFAQDPNCSGVETASNGREAREKLNSSAFDLVTLDIHMPEVNGIEFLERLYRKQSDPPVVMVSSVNRTDLDLATKSLSLGAFDYVEKPAMNNLRKSADEILTKAKMALRQNPSPAMSTTAGGFEASISQKIVTPDASQCLRAVLVGPESGRQIEPIIKGLENESRSPALLIVWEGAETAKLEAALLDWTRRPIAVLRKAATLKPNHIYIVPGENLDLVGSLNAKSVSLQVLHVPFVDLGVFSTAKSVQVLIDESASGDARERVRKSKLKISDITPVTSFPSLSLEFFANLRKAAA